MIIGAGQAGLSVAYHLKRGGLRMGEDVVILDRGPAEGGAWQHRWEALRLGSAHRVNDLPGMREMGLSFDTADRDRPARDVVREYYREYERFYDLRVQRPVVVTAVQDDGSRLVVRHDRGEHRTAAVVNATGTWGAPYLPYYPGVRRFAGIQTHTAGYRSAEDFRGLRVLVAGGIAVTLGVSERDPRLFFAGYGPQASTIGANRAGKVIARQVLRLVA